jgi:hypothetical protein
MDQSSAVTVVALKGLSRLFPSRKDIVEEVLHSWRDTWKTNLRAQVKSKQLPGERLLAVFDLLADRCCGGGDEGMACANGVPGRG